MAGAGDPIDFKALYVRIHENRERLDACPRHLFERLYVEPRQLGQKAVCDRCGGELALEYVNQYVRGYEASGKSGNDIVPGWKEPGNEPPERSYFTPST